MTEYDPDEVPTSPVNSQIRMTIPQVREALSSFPHEQQPLILAMLRAADDNGFLRGVANLTRLGPFEHHPASDRPAEAPKKVKRP